MEAHASAEKKTEAHDMTSNERSKKVSNVQLLINPPVTNPAVLEDRIRVSHPNTGEFLQERVQTVLMDVPACDSPDLTKNEYLPSESSLSDYESDNDSEEAGEKRHKSTGRVKKVKNKLTSALRKLTGRRDSHEEVHEQHVEQHHHHGHHCNSHKSDAVANSMSIDFESSLLDSPALHRDTLVQHNLQAAFAREGLQATHSVSAPRDTRNRYEPETVETLNVGCTQDILDHRGDSSSRLGESAQTALLHDKPLPSAVPPSHQKFHGEFIQAYRDLPKSSASEISSPQRSSPLSYSAVDVSPSLSGNIQEMSKKFDSLSCRQEAPFARTNLFRSPELWDVPGEVRHEAKEDPLTLSEAERNAEEFSEHFQRIGEHRNSLTEENLTLGEAEKKAEEFSEHFHRIGEHRNSLTNQRISSPAVSPGYPHAKRTPEHPVVHLLTSFDEPLTATKTGWRSPVKDAIRMDKSESDLLELEKSSRSSQPFERTESEFAISKNLESSNTEDTSSSPYRFDSPHHLQCSPWAIPLSNDTNTITSVSTSSPDSSSDELPIPDVSPRPYRPSPHASQIISPPMDDSAIFERDVVPEMIPPVHPMHDEVRFVDLESMVLPTHPNFLMEERLIHYPDSPMAVETESSGLRSSQELIKKSDHILDAEFEGRDLEPHHDHQKADFISTIPRNYVQPIMENYELPNQAETGIGNTKVVLETDKSSSKDQSTPKGVIATVVGSLTGTFSAVTGAFTHKSHLDEDDNDSEYLPFEITGKSDVGFSSGHEIKHKDFEPHMNIVDTVIGGVINLIHGKTDSDGSEKSRQTNAVSTETPVESLPVSITGEFISPVSRDN